MTKGLEARAAALDLLGEVLERRRPLDEALQQHERLASLEARDRAFARLLAATCLRRLGQLDAALAGLLARPLKPKLAPLRQVLRLGLCQILFLETPPHAAVDTSVRLAAKAGFAGHKGLVNAVLRRAGRELPPLVAEQEAFGEAARLNTPDWLWDALSQAYGEETAQAIAVAHLKEPPLDLTLKDPASAADWAKRLDARILPTGGLRLPPGAGDVARLAGYREGAWWVQDLAASLPARLVKTEAGQTVIDLCAAPGGKTAQLAAAGLRVIAVERDAGRLRRLASNLERLDLAAALVEADAGTWRPPEPVAAALLDAPCSATGTLRRHPDIARLKGPSEIQSEIPALTALQDRLLAAAVEMVRPGGLIVYATCSLQPEEGP
ncbi:MAG: transcription antitermination factor NusB, partial [Kiloniellales bacterium]|nr:transcription antitermination factor NusB [Kiloniellales bacterium]